MLLVGNHSGGNVTPDTFIFTLAFSSYFGIERKFHQLAHNLVVTLPVSGALVRRGGTVAASHKNAEKALEAGAALLVYPGGDWEVHRPSWDGDKVDFAGRKGFIRLALDQDVPIVPVVSSAARKPRCSSPGRPPGQGPAAGPHLPPQGPADLDRRSLGPQRRRLPGPRAAAGEDHDRGPAGHRPARAVRPRADVDEVYDHVTRLMQETLEALAAERRYPLIG